MRRAFDGAEHSDSIERVMAGRTRHRRVLSSRTAPARNSAVTFCRARLPVLLDPILDIVSAFRKMSTKPEQARVQPADLDDAPKRLCDHGGAARGSFATLAGRTGQARSKN
jgi:hypothetical protein